MTLHDFRKSLAEPAPPPGLTQAAAALWWDARGDWARAHDCAQRQDDAEGALVHAYLHRKEGDIPNALYWYRRSGRPAATATLAQEWEMLVVELAYA
jgi:hypothetical protein